ncbi:hypothetical protein [Pseudomonas sp. CGJS7]|uniref:hypothetical protein n=1 Tax=Pseudomonas sp. CGJS7 TaxID=3109348 RepID=UPI003009807C
MTRIYYGQAQIEASVAAAFDQAVVAARKAGEWLNPRNGAQRRDLLNLASGGESAQIRTALQRYFGVNFPLSAADLQFVDRLGTVYRAMATALNVWTVHVSYADLADHDEREYASTRPPVIFPNAEGEVDTTNPNSFRATWAEVRANIDQGTRNYTFVHNLTPVIVNPATELAYKIVLNSRFRNVSAFMKCETVLHEMSHALADTNDAAYADDVATARQICAVYGSAVARDTADCWGFFPMDW